MLENCKAGNHDLKTIYSNIGNYDEENVVRWCTICGSIVVDKETDGRILPGAVSKMISPKITKVMAIKS